MGAVSGDGFFCAARRLHSELGLIRMNGHFAKGEAPPQVPENYCLELSSDYKGQRNSLSTYSAEHQK